MKYCFVFLLVFIASSFCRQISFDEFEYSPTAEEGSDIIDYGSLKVTRSKNRTILYIKGNFTLLKNLGNEKLITTEVKTSTNIMLGKMTHGFCEFAKTEKNLWPEMLKASDLPKDEPCPLPKGAYHVKKFPLQLSKQQIQPLRPGNYVMKIEMTESGKSKLAFVIKFSIKS